MKIYALNGIQSQHTESVKKNVSLVGSVVLRGVEIFGVVQLLEGSHRMGYAVELELPIHIVLFNDDEVVPHDCDDVDSPTTGLSDYATAGELARALIIERGLLLYKVAVYESDDFSNIHLLKPVDETGKTLHARLISGSPFSAFPEKVWAITFGEMKDVVSKDVLVLGSNSVADAFVKLGADVTFVDMTVYQDERDIELNGRQFDLIYTSDLHNDLDLCGLFSSYKKLLKAEGLAVTLNEKQNSELVSSVGLDIYAFLDMEENVVSFVKQKK